MHKALVNFAGWIPAIILPAATLFQLVKIARLKTAEGVSLMTWLLFGIANLALYIYTEKYFDLQPLIGLIGTALLNFVIVGLVLRFRTNRKSTYAGKQNL